MKKMTTRRQKERQGTKGTHSLAPQKAHATGELACYCGIKWCLCAASFDLQPCEYGQAGMHAGRQMKFEMGKFFKILYLVTCILFLILYLMLDGLTLFHKGDFHCVRCL